MPTRTEAIAALLKAKTHEDLAKSYSHDMEVQVIVAQDDGERVDDEYKGVKWSGYTDGYQTWKPFRVPRNADTEPEFTDSALKFDLGGHAEGIGMTGWDWKSRLSRWVAFDFDAITGHSDKHEMKLSHEELKNVRQAASEIPWVTTRYSTSGKGLHLYVYLEPVRTNNHTEHAALSRAILSQMSALVGFDFESRVDTCGGNMWVWHRKMDGTRGLSVIKQGNKLAAPPENWKAHLNVVRGRQRRIKHDLPDTGIPEVEANFEGLTNQRNRVRLDGEHKRLIQWLHDESRFFWWDPDAHMLVTHTIHLKAAHDELSMRGIFNTTSDGTNVNEQNCFAYPLRKGAWSVRRYSMGVGEHPSWSQDGKGWTQCFLNQQPDLRTAALSHDAIEDPSGGFVFYSLTDAKNAAMALGADVSTPAGFDGRQMIIKPHKDGKRIVTEFPRENNDIANQLPGWLAKGNKWVKIFTPTANVAVQSEITGEDYDDVIRHLVTSGEDRGWVLRSNNRWIDEPLNHIRVALDSMGLKAAEAKQVLGVSVLRPWNVVVKPFQPEYPGNREWNRHAPQFRFQPSEGSDLFYPTWKMILNHIGRSLTFAVEQDDWCQANGLKTGGDYLKCWIASVIQHPFEPLPYLFIYGLEQRTGKSLFHESISLLFKPGYQRAESALTNPNNFNAELEEIIVCVVEEMSLKESSTANQRMKDWVTARELSIHRKGITPYMVRNSTHWIHCANPRSACPIFPGDTRITMVHVPRQPENPIPKGIMIERLEKEAPDFIAELLRLELPDAPDRLRIPVLETDDKITAQEANRTALEVFISECCYEIPGATVTLAEFFTRFTLQLSPGERMNWNSKQSVSAKMPDRFPKGRTTGDSTWRWGNISFDPETPPSRRLAAAGKILVPDWSEETCVSST